MNYSSTSGARTCSEKAYSNSARGIRNNRNVDLEDSNYDFQFKYSSKSIRLLSDEYIEESIRSIVARENFIIELCEGVHSIDLEFWDSIRACCESVSYEQAQEALEQLGDHARCPLHLVCMQKPPKDVVQFILQVAPETTEWVDINGCTPLHYACANGASSTVIRMLVIVTPDSCTMQDNKGRTPLHLGLSNESPVSAEVIQDLAKTGAAKMGDTRRGMIPLHYACANGVRPEVLRALIIACPKSATMKDLRGRVALHFVMGNGDGATSEALVTNITSIDPQTVNMIDNEGISPLHLFALCSEKEDADEKNLAKCLRAYLSANPYATVDFLTALQSMSDPMIDIAVLTPYVQQVLNEKTVKRVPSAILLMDFYCQIIRIVTFTLGVNQSLDIRSSGNKGLRPDFWITTVLYIIAGYFIAREIIQIMSLYFLSLFRNWLYDYGNWMDMATILVNVCFTIMIQYSWGDDELFRQGATFSIGLLWISTLLYVKSVNIEFSVFVGGVFYVLKNLTAFLISAVILLLTFAQIFFSLFTLSDQCDKENFFFCDLHSSFVQSVQFMLGTLDDTFVNDNPVAIVFLILFILVIIIILSTVLIAIISDNFIFIKGERAELVFWSNRLDYVAGMEAITNGPWKKAVMEVIIPKGKSASGRDILKKPDDYEEFGRDFWDRITSIFQDEKLHINSIDFFAISLLRLISALFICLIFLPFGALTAGVLWPPQIREYLFKAKATHEATAASQIDELKGAMKELIEEVSELRYALESKTMNNRKEINEVRMQLQDLQDGIQNEVKVVKDLAIQLAIKHQKENVEIPDDDVVKKKAKALSHTRKLKIKDNVINKNYQYSRSNIRGNSAA